MVNPINALFEDGITETFILEDDKEILGMIKADVSPSCVIIHPHLYKVTKTTFFKIKELLKEVTKSIHNRYGFTSVSAITHNHKFVNMITEGKAVVVMEKAGTRIYELEIV